MGKQHTQTGRPVVVDLPQSGGARRRRSQQQHQRQRLNPASAVAHATTLEFVASLAAAKAAELQGAGLDLPPSTVALIRRAASLLETAAAELVCHAEGAA